MVEMEEVELDVRKKTKFMQLASIYDKIDECG